jgi:hypothetical protein
VTPCFMASQNNDDNTVTLDRFFKPKKSKAEVCGECGYFVSPQNCRLNGTETKPSSRTCSQAIGREEMATRGII